MKTTLELPEDLLEEAMRRTRIKSETEVVVKALKELVRRKNISDLKQFKGKINLDIDLDSIRSRGCRF